MPQIGDSVIFRLRRLRKKRRYNPFAKSNRQIFIGLLH